MKQAKVFIIRPRVLVAEERESYPLNLVAVLSSVENINVEKRVVDIDFLYRQGASFSAICGDLLAEISRIGLPIVGISVNDAALPEALYLAERIKERAKNSRIVLGGPGVYFNSAGIMAEFGHLVDYIVRGEAERTFPALVSGILKGKAGEPVPGVIDFPAVVRMDDYAFPQYDRLPPSLYGTGPGVEYIPVLAGAGCANQCKYCSTSNFWGHKVRYKSVERVVREISFLKSLGVSKVELVHDNLFHDMTYVGRLAGTLMRGGVRVSWACSGRADDFDMAAAPLLARAGCRRIFWGIESGSEKGLRVLNKRLPLESSVRKVRKVSEKYPVHSQLSFIYNFPGDDLESFKRTLELAFRLKSENPGKVQVALNNFLALSGAVFTRNALLKKSRYLIRQMNLGPTFAKRVAGARELFSFFYKPGNITSLGEKFRLTRLNFVLNGFPGTIAVLLRKYGLLDTLRCFQKSEDLEVAVRAMVRRDGDALPGSLTDIFRFEYLGAVPPARPAGKKRTGCWRPRTIQRIYQ
ncbi:MAG: Fe-S oxidoreductase [Elusimicrobia bacterium]|nr:MAG: Fe-S oxidoreductase [Elusimicrobiota bacterium]KAF0157460.1 MAG: Fe-S oxidoreductase [Elusimicrobiota bacterium]